MSDDALEIITEEPRLAHESSGAALELLRLVPDLPDSFLRDVEDEAAGTRRFVVQARRPNLAPQPPLAVAACRLPAIGTYARLWGPHMQTGAPAAASLRCLEAVSKILVSTAATHVVTVVDKLDARLSDPFQELGYVKMTDVLHLVSVQEHSSAATHTDARGRPRLVLSAVDETTFERFLALLQETYRGSDDCPELADQYSLDEVRSRWQRTPAASRTAGWHMASIVENDGPADNRSPAERSIQVGCLVVDLGAQPDHAELVYMGLIKAQRGKGLGTALVSCARHITSRFGIKKTIVSVDANNARALACYLSQGFVCYAESSVLVCQLSK